MVGNGELVKTRENKHQEKNFCLGNKEFTQRQYSGEKQDQKPDHKGLRDIDKTMMWGTTGMREKGLLYFKATKRNE